MNWFRPHAPLSDLDTDLAAEIREHLDEKIEDLVARGIPREEAEYTAKREFGNATLIQEDSHAIWRRPHLENLAADVRYGLRVLRKNPGFTAVAILTLTLGIGSTAAIFSVVDAVLLRSLPYRNADRLVSLYEDRSRTGFPRKEFTPANYIDCKQQTDVFEDLAAIDPDRFYTLTENGSAPERLFAEGVTRNLFPILGVRPALGRTFLPDEDQRGSDHVVLLSYRLWLGRFGGDRSVLGRNILLSGQKYLVVGVMPAGFSFPNKNADLWVPAAFTPQDLANRGSHFLMVVGTLRPGVSIQQANAKLMLLSQELRRQHMDIMQFVEGFVAERLQDVYTKDARKGLIVLQAAVSLILLIACANIANLLLSRAASRHREIALRSALGANRLRVVQQLITESAVLATAGGILGIVLTEANFRFLNILIPSDLSQTVSVTLNLPVLLFAILISLLSTFLFGLVPALQTTRIDVSESLKEGGRAGIGSRRKGLGKLLVIGEVALCLVLLISSGLLLKSFANLRHVDPGFRADHVLTARIDVPETSDRDFLARTQMFQRILDRVRALPGVENAGFTSALPLTWKSGMAGFVPEGVIRPDLEYAALNRVVSPGYFEAMRIPLLRGRLFNDHDGPAAPSAAIINETMARKFWPNQNALDKQFRINLGDRRFRLFRIVGVVGNVRQMGLNAAPKEEMYFPFWQAQSNYMAPRDLVIRTAADPIKLASAVRHAVWTVAPDQPVSDVMTLADVLDREVEQRQIQTLLLGGLAGLALILACVGIYGVIAYMVAQENHEIGIRVALGAGSANVLRLILGRGLALTGTGVAIGIFAALIVTRYMKTLLFEVSPIDPLIFLLVAALLTSIALAATYLPARRAMRIDPMVALRCE